MVVLSLLSNFVLWGIVLLLGFLLLGTLRALARLRWRVEQLEAITPSRLGRSGLKLGRNAPDFILPSVEGAEMALHDWTGRKLLLVFMQPGCQPCNDIVPELKRLWHDGDLQVLAITSGNLETSREWALQVGASFPVVVQEDYRVSRRYEVFATPFAFLIDEQGVIASKGLVTKAEHIGFVLSRQCRQAQLERVEPSPGKLEQARRKDSLSVSA